MKPNHLLIFLLGLLISFLLLASAWPAEVIQPLAQKWVARYNGPENRDDFSSVVTVDASGDLYVAGYTTNPSRYADACLIKFKADTGQRLWEWHAGAPRPAGDFSPDVMPLISRIAIGPDGNPVVMAQTSMDYVGIASRVLKFRASDGSIVWERTSTTGDSDATYALALDGNGDVLAGGSSNGRGSTIKYSGSTGATIWQRQFGPASQYSPGVVRAMRLDTHGDVIVTGYERMSDFRYQAYSGKYAGTDGTVRWETRLVDPTSSLQGRELALDASGNAIVAMSNGLVCKYESASGAQLWQRQLASTPFDLVVDSAGDIYVAISTYTTGTAAGATLAKLAGSTGDVRWSRPGYGEFFSSLLLRGGEILVAGQRSSSSDDLLLAAFDPSNGTRRWDATYGASNLQDRMSNTWRPNGRIALQADGGVVITGCSQGASSGYDFAVLRYGPGPGLKNGRADQVLRTGARLGANVVDNGASATVAWQYGPTTAYGQTTALVSVRPSPTTYPSNSTYISSSSSLHYTTVTGLSENTTFHARAVATSAAGITYGDDFVFTTKWDANGNHLPDDWELANWGNTVWRAATGDDDMDGWNNLLEYALGRNPRAADSGSSAPITLESDYLTATISKQPFVTYLVESSNDLLSWGTADTTILADDETSLVVRSNLPLSADGAHFLRIRVTAQ